MCNTSPKNLVIALIAIIGALLILQALTAPTIYVDKEGYVYKVNDKVLDTPTKNPELFREAGKTVFDK